MSEMCLAKKKNHLIAILNRLNEWDGASETALSVLEENEESIQEIKLIDQKLTETDLKSFQNKNIDLLEKVMKQQRLFLDQLKKQSIVLSKQMKQMNQQKRVVHNYMDKESSLFVDREV